MKTIGHFKKVGNGYEGTIETFVLDVKVKFVPNEKTAENQPDYRLVRGRSEVGGAWKRTAKEGEREYLSVSIDDPSFSDTVRARLFEAEDKSFNLVWNRQKEE